MALFGFFSIPYVKKLQDGGTPSNPQDKAATAARAAQDEDEHEQADYQDLRPLVNYLSDGGSSQPKPSDLKAMIRDKVPRAKCLVVTLPQPVAGVMSYRFDELLDVVQRAAERRGYTLDRSHMPWHSDQQGAGASADGTSHLRVDRIGLDLKIEANVHSKPKRPRPGLMVFKTGAASPEPNKLREPPAILVVFVVPESPISGIDKATFARCLDLIDLYFCSYLTQEAAPINVTAGEPVHRRVLHIIAPSFSGSQSSFERALEGWGKSHGNPYHFRIVSHWASQILKDRIEGIFPTVDGHRLTFHSMVHKSSTVLTATLNYIAQDPADIALLTESNTWIQSATWFAESVKDFGRLDKFVFPLHISEVRKIYEKEGFLRYSKIEANTAPERLTIPPDEAGAPRDLPVLATPASSAAIDEMALTQILTTMSHRPYRAIGIVATDPLDIVFLARRVRRFCPNVRLFTAQGDLLFARPQDVADLRGMIVGATYPLYPANQWISRPTPEPHVLFSDQFAQGLYNAMLAHLWELGVADTVHPGRALDGPRLVEYGPPYVPWTKTNEQPPVWISAVGQRGLFPLTFVVPDIDYYIYTPATCPEGRVVQERPPEIARDQAERAQKAMRPNVHPLVLYLFLFLFLASIAVAYVTYHYVSWAMEEKNQDPDPEPYALNYVLKYLNCGIVTEECQNDSYPPPVGAGMYLCLSNLVVFGLYYYLLSFWIVAMAPYRHLEFGMTVLEFGLALLGASLVAGSTALALAEFGIALRGARASLRVRLNRLRLLFAFLGILISLTSLLSLILIVVATEAKSNWRLTYERITNLPSGVSPVFPLLFLAGAVLAWIHAQLARRRLYRLSYLSEKLPRAEKDHPFEKILGQIRRSRVENIDCLIRKPLHVLARINPALSWGLIFLFCALVIRLLSRGWIGSFEGPFFDYPFWVAFFVVVALIVVHTLQLLTLWGEIRSSLRLAVELPMVEAFDRIPTRLKGWFFGDEDFATREELLRQQTTALKNRSTDELADVFAKVFSSEGDQNVWRERLCSLKSALENEPGTLKSTRSVYSFLYPLWSSSPVENRSGVARAGALAREQDADWKVSWPFSTKECSQQEPSLITRREHEIVRDWARLAEDLIALQIVRWFAPALSQLLPIMHFVILGSLSLLLAAASYPFDHQGWVMMTMVLLIAFVAGSVVAVLVGVYRDELISRVSDTTPGKLSFDSGFVSSLATMVVPLLGALLAVSFDLSDLIHTWFGPMLQLF
jgi:hypothetical protein